MSQPRKPTPEEIGAFQRRRERERERAQEEETERYATRVIFCSKLDELCKEYGLRIEDCGHDGYAFTFDHHSPGSDLRAEDC